MNKNQNKKNLTHPKNSILNMSSRYVSNIHMSNSSKLFTHVGTLSVGMVLYLVKVVGSFNQGVKFSTCLLVPNGL